MKNHTVAVIVFVCVVPSGYVAVNVYGVEAVNPATFIVPVAGKAVKLVTPEGRDKLVVGVTATDLALGAL